MTIKIMFAIMLLFEIIILIDRKMFLAFLKIQTIKNELRKVGCEDIEPAPDIIRERTIVYSIMTIIYMIALIRLLFSPYYINIFIIIGLSLFKAIFKIDLDNNKFYYIIDFPLTSICLIAGLIR